MHVGAIRFELRLPGCRSLKDKRAVIKPIVEGSWRRYRVAAAEVARHNAWQQACLGMAAVAGTVGHVEEVLDEVERFVWSHPEIEVLSAERSWVDAES